MKLTKHPLSSAATVSTLVIVVPWTFVATDKQKMVLTVDARIGHPRSAQWKSQSNAVESRELHGLRVLNGSHVRNGSQVHNGSQVRDESRVVRNGSQVPSSSRYSRERVGASRRSEFVGAVYVNNLVIRTEGAARCTRIEIAPAYDASPACATIGANARHLHTQLPYMQLPDADPVDSRFQVTVPIPPLAEAFHMSSRWLWVVFQLLAIASALLFGPGH